MSKRSRSIGGGSNSLGRANSSIIGGLSSSRRSRAPGGVANHEEIEYYLKNLYPSSPYTFEVTYNEDNAITYTGRDIGDTFTFKGEAWLGRDEVRYTNYGDEPYVFGDQFWGYQWRVHFRSSDEHEVPIFEMTNDLTVSHWVRRNTNQSPAVFVQAAWQQGTGLITVALARTNTANGLPVWSTGGPGNLNNNQTYYLQVWRDGNDADTDYKFAAYSVDYGVGQVGTTATLSHYGGSGADDWNNLLVMQSSGRGISNQPNDYDITPDGFLGQIVST